MDRTIPAPDIHSTAGKLTDLDRRMQEAVHAGSAAAVEKQHAKGKKTARERIQLLLDPDSFTELDLDDVRGLIWDEPSSDPPDRKLEPTVRELEILGALWSYRFLFARQVYRRWWKGSSVRAAQQTLNKMTRAGWVRRSGLAAMARR